MQNRKFRSCYVSDVIINDERIQLIDSVGRFYYVSESAKKTFQEWFANIFLQGIAQTLTVFEYKSVDISECEIELQIVNFITKTKKPNV